MTNVLLLIAAEEAGRQFSDAGAPPPTNSIDVQEAYEAGRDAAEEGN